MCPANYLGHFALTGLLLPLIVKTQNSRIVTLSSLAHKWSGIRFHDLHATRRYDKRLAYGQSKLACLVFALTGLWLLALHARQRGLTWPMVGLGGLIPLLIALLLVH